MLNFLNKIMNKDNNNKEFIKHRILNTDIYKEVEDGEESILFGCGCFWGAEKCFWKLPGVVTTSVGYAGGSLKNPSYEEVCGGYTGHAEVVKVIWEIDKIDISDLLKMFWECHNPTQKNRQGNDIGTQYRSTIFYRNDKYKEIIFNSRKSYQESLKEYDLGIIETEIKKVNQYYFAEEYHQQYLAVDGSRQYCSAAPTNIKLKDFDGSNYKLNQTIWDNFDWTIDKCVLRSSNEPIK